MKRLNQKNLLLLLCSLQFAATLRTLLGIVGLSYHQEIPSLATAFELGLFLGASLIPLAVTLAPPESRRLWHGLAWVPCFAYALLCSFNLLARQHMDLGQGVAAFVRLACWLSIGVLFASRAVCLVHQQQKA